MTPPVRFAGALAALAAAATVAPPAAAAPKRAGERTFQQTYPEASRLCAEIASGTGQKRLRQRRFATQILADCAALENGFNAARASLLAAKASIASARAADKAIAASACAGAAVKTAACATSRHKQQQLLNALTAEQIREVHVYYFTVEANRRVFWSAIRPLPGGARLRPDTRIPVQSA
jgi:hypothetical protein